MYTFGDVQARWKHGLNAKLENTIILYHCDRERPYITFYLPSTQAKMRMTDLFASDCPVYVTAPMINQSDLAFRVLTRRYGATLTYTQMLHPDKLMYDRDYLEHHILNMDPQGTPDLTSHGDLQLGKPVVAQVCGNDVQKIVEACKKIVGHCDAIGQFFTSEVCGVLRIRGTDKLVRFELGMSSHIRSGRALRRLFAGTKGLAIGRKYWCVAARAIDNGILNLGGCIVSGLTHTFPVPISTKMRLCNPVEHTLPLAKRLALAGSSWITLHARFGASTRKRRHGPADLSQVKLLKENLQVPVISNGNVRAYEDVVQNCEFTCADGIMVGETLLGNPWCVPESNLWWTRD